MKRAAAAAAALVLVAILSWPFIKPISMVSGPGRLPGQPGNAELYSAE
jgi:hypothetical protein